MPATPPVFTVTPPVLNSQSPDYPVVFGSQIGATTDANFNVLKNWSTDLEDDFEAVRWTPATAFITAATNFTVSTSTYLFERGDLHVLHGTISRTAGTALVSTASGVITSTTMATLTAGYRPTYEVFFWARTVKGPFLATYINTAGAIVLRGATQISYTFPATWSIDFEAVWIV